MNQIFRRTLALLLSLVLLVGVMPVSALAADKLATVKAVEGAKEEPISSKPTIGTYTILGDSIAAGYALPSYKQNEIAYPDLCDKIVPEDSYAGILSSTFRVETVNGFAHSGWRSTEFLRHVAGVPGDEYSDLFYTSMGSKSFEDVDAEVEGMRQAIADADLITVNYGANDVFTYSMMATLTEYLFSGELEFPELDFEVKSLCDLFRLFSALLEVTEDAKGVFDYLVAKCEKGLAMYEANLPVMLSYLEEHKAPGAKVLVLSVDNAAKLSLNLTDSFALDLYTIADLFAARASYATEVACRSYSDIQYVNVNGAEYNGLLNMTFTGNLEDIVSFLDAVHPSHNGHAEIAGKLIPYVTAAFARPAAKVEKNVLGQAKVTWEKVDGALSYRVYRSTKPDSGYILVSATPLTGCLDLTTSLGTNYYYRVVAVMNLAGTLRTGAGEPVELVHFTEAELQSAKAAACAKLEKTAGSKPSKAVRSLVESGKGKIGACASIDEVNLAAAAAVASVEAQLHLEKPVTSLVKDVGRVATGVTKTAFGAVGGLVKALTPW